MIDSRLEAIFDGALQKASDAERAAYLEGACGQNVDLRGRVETLLRAHSQASGFLQATISGDPPREGPGTVIGRYKLLQQIGEGGFGVVYMAEQHEPVHASQPSVIYKLRKFAWRNRRGVTAALLVAAALLTGLAMATAGFVRASREAERSRAIARFLEDVVVAVALDSLAMRSQHAGDMISAERLFRESSRSSGSGARSQAPPGNALAARLRLT